MKQKSDIKKQNSNKEIKKPNITVSVIIIVVCVIIG